MVARLKEIRHRRRWYDFKNFWCLDLRIITLLPNERTDSRSRLVTVIRLIDCCGRLQGWNLLIQHKSWTAFWLKIQDIIQEDKAKARTILDWRYQILTERKMCCVRCTWRPFSYLNLRCWGWKIFHESKKNQWIVYFCPFVLGLGSRLINYCRCFIGLWIEFRQCPNQAKSKCFVSQKHKMGNLVKQIRIPSQISSSGCRLLER